MRYFIVEATYTQPFASILPTIPEHRAFLQAGYDAGLFLCSGPKSPPVGGFLVARSESCETLKVMFQEEPFNKAQLATYTFTEFEPVKRQEWANDWFSGRS